MPLRLALGVRETMAAHRLGALEGGGGGGGLRCYNALLVRQSMLHGRGGAGEGRELSALLQGRQMYTHSWGGKRPQHKDQFYNQRTPACLP